MATQDANTDTSAPEAPKTPEIPEALKVPVTQAAQLAPAATPHKATAPHKAQAAQTTPAAPTAQSVQKTLVSQTLINREAAKTKRLLISVVSTAAVLVIVATLSAVFVMLQPTGSFLQQSYLTVDSDRELGPLVYPDGFYPLTGRPFYLDWIEDPEQRAAQASAIMLARPVCIKIENSPDARPQTGLSLADVVYETVVEGGITRFNCVFQSYLPVEVGPVRSARNSDVSIVPQYQAVLFYSGCNETVLSQMYYAGFPFLTEGEEGFYRVDWNWAPHNLYYSPQMAYSDIQANGYGTTVTYPPTLEFLKLASPESVMLASISGLPAPVFSSETANPAATPTSQISIPFSPGFVIDWSWQGEGLSGRWLRSQDGEAYYEAIDGSQLGATNVVVLWTSYIYVDAGGGTYEIELNGYGDASIFTQGGRIDGTWETDGSTPPRFRSYDGSIIYLTPGNTWFQVISYDTDISSW